MSQTNAAGDLLEAFRLRLFHNKVSAILISNLLLCFQITFKTILKKTFKNCIVGSVVEWLKHRTDDQHGLGSKPTCAILLCPWERHFTVLSPAWWF